MSTFKSSGLDPKILMELVRSSEPEKELTFKKKLTHYFVITAWMRDYNVRSGTILNGAVLLHKHFLLWAKEHGEQDVKLPAFGKFLGKIFHKKQSFKNGNRTYYSLNQKLVEDDDIKKTGP